MNYDRLQTMLFFKHHSIWLFSGFKQCWCWLFSSFKQFWRLNDVGLRILYLIIFRVKKIQCWCWLFSGFKQCGSLNLAKTRDRVEFLKRRVAAVKPSGIGVQVIILLNVEKLSVESHSSNWHHFFDTWCAGSRWKAPRTLARWWKAPV